MFVSETKSKFVSIVNTLAHLLHKEFQGIDNIECYYLIDLLSLLIFNFPLE